MKHCHVPVITGLCVTTLNAENPSLLGCDAVSFGNNGGLLDPEDEGTMILRNV
jgi:hypothetical protein